MRRLWAFVPLTLGALLVHACALPHWGIDPSLDQPAAAGGNANDGGSSSQVPGGAPATPDAGGAGGTRSETTIVEEGAACTDDAATACKGSAQAGRLVCQGGIWTSTDDCPEQQYCDRSSGDCQDIVEACAGATPGKRFCSDSNEVTECGPDLVTTKVVDSCAETCVETGDTADCVPKSCGDHQRQEPEQCDDGNKDDTDDCTSACKVAHCGDTAIWEGHESCDDGNTVTEPCPYGMKTCSVCNSKCQSEAGKASYCGDGVFQADNEQCDSASAATVNQCNAKCELTAMALWPLPYLTPTTYSYLTDFVDDSTTGLEWQRNPDDTLRTWEDAMTYCQALTLLNKTDWRLPTKIELNSLVDYNKGKPGPCIDTFMFPKVGGESFWSSSKMMGNDNAFDVDFSDGSVDQRAKNLTSKVLCVR